MDMRKRALATQATLDRFQGVAFEWGKHDCVRMAVFHLRQTGRRPRIAKAGSYTSALSARRALSRAGFSTLAEAVDAQGLAPIPPAAAVAGDIVELRSDAEQDGTAIGALAICLGNGRLLGFVPEADHRCVVFQPSEMVRAWRA